MTVPTDVLADRLERVARLLRTRGAHQAAGVCRCIACTADLLAVDGYPAACGSAKSRGGVVSLDPDGDVTLTSVEAAAVAGGRDHAGEWRAALDGLLVAGERLELVAARITSSTVAGAGPAGVGQCQACDHWCPGGNDRLRAGFCNACRMAWDRFRHAGGSDRREFITKRRHAREGTAA